MRHQVGFIDFVVQPLLEPMIRVFPGLLTLKDWCSRLPKGPAERGHVKKRQKVSKSFSTLFDNFRAGQKTSKIAKKRQKIFRHFSRGTIFPAPFGGALRIKMPQSIGTSLGLLGVSKAWKTPIKVRKGVPGARGRKCSKKSRKRAKTRKTLQKLSFSTSIMAPGQRGPGKFRTFSEFSRERPF